MAEHGGYRQPSHPAPVSGPGAHSARTDTGPKHYQVSGGSYGDAQQFQQQQSGAPLAPKPGAPGGTAPQPQMPQLTGLSEPTQMPHVPVTDGAAAGPGLGPEAIQSAPSVNPNAEEAQSLAKWLPTLIQQADADGATPGFKRYVRQIIQNL